MIHANIFSSPKQFLRARCHLWQYLRTGKRTEISKICQMTQTQKCPNLFTKLAAIWRLMQRKNLGTNLRAFVNPGGARCLKLMFIKIRLKWFGQSTNSPENVSPLYSWFCKSFIGHPICTSFENGQNKIIDRTILDTIRCL